MKIIVPVILNIILVIGIYFLRKIGRIKDISSIKNQIMIGLIFGAVSAFASDFGEEVMGIVVNVRDAAPITAGLVFGPISAIIAGLIGGAYRAFSILWGASTFTVVACTTSTIVAGIATALLKHFMFDNKRPTVTYAVGITVVLEIFHMLMIFVTNFTDANQAFEIVRQCTILMVLANSISVGLSVLAVMIFNKELKFRRQKKEKGITDTFQVWLFITIVIAFGFTGIFTFNIQTVMNNHNIHEMFTVSMTDAGTEIQQESNNRLLNIALDVKEKYIQNPDVDLTSLLTNENYEITAINIISSDATITKSTDSSLIGYDMSIKPQSSAFMTLINQKDKTFVQNFGYNDKGVLRKYAGVSLDDGGFIQVGYDAEQFYNSFDSYIINTTKNRHIGANGFIAVCDENFNIVIDNEYSGKHISSIGIPMNDELLNKKQASVIYKTDIINEETGFKAEYMYVFAFIEGYCMLAAMPVEEAMLMRDASIYLSLFMLILIFAVLFVLIFHLIKKIIVKNLHKVNDDLALITDGNLDIVVNVRTNKEFSSLSDDINSTVDTLKRYISEAAARIDKELEYAKQIQLAAIPTNYPDDDNYEIFAKMIAAREVGGDFYDFYEIDETHVVFLVADVSGKGIPAAMFMMKAKTILKHFAESGNTVEEIFTKTNQKLCENNDAGMFVTAWMGVLDLETDTLSYVNAGHNPPLISREGGNYEYLKSRPGFVLGGIDNFVYRQSELKLNEHDCIFLYTDGVTEATNNDNELYGEIRLKDFMNLHKDVSTKEMLFKIKENIDSFVDTAPQADDITMLLFNYKKQQKDVLKQTFKAKDNELPNIIEMLEEILVKNNCSVKNISSISLCVEEMFVNISHYAYNGQEGECTIQIEFKHSNRELTIIMEDNGVPFNPLTKDDPNIHLRAEERNIGGLGIFIVKKIMDNVSYRYENDTNILIMKKTI